MKNIIGDVIHGEKLGRELGFPTANISYSKNDIDDSVFHINIIIDGVIYRWMWSYMKSKKVFEAHIFDFDKDIYGEKIEVILLKKIRDNKKFSSLKELIKQIQKDQKTILLQKLNILTFGSFDIVHEWHKHYLFEAKKYGTHLITIVATDKNIENIKWHHPLHSTLERSSAILELWISDEVVSWSEEKPLKWIKKYKPHALCLGYDQRGKFVDKIPETIKELWLSTEIIKISPLKPEVYKSSFLKNKKKKK